MIFLFCSLWCKMWHSACFTTAEKRQHPPTLPLKACSKINLCIICSLTFHQQTRSNYCVNTKKMLPFSPLHAVYDHLLMMNKHVWDMLTELWLLLVLHDWKPMAAGYKTQTRRMLGKSWWIYFRMLAWLSKRFYVILCGMIEHQNWIIKKTTSESLLGNKQKL